MTPPDRTVDAAFFDLFGTLVSLGPLVGACDRVAPGRGAELAARWRARQLETSWLRTAMDRWANFDAVTHDTLLVTLQELGITGLDDRDLAALADAFTELPLVAGAADAVGRLRAGGLVTGILTNASAATLGRVADRLDLPIDYRLSVDAVRRYKPHPSVYRLAVDATGLAAERIGFVTANGWDAAGASAFGFRVAWLRPTAAARLPAVGAPEPAIATWPEIAAVFGVP
ncbi:MAG TPA: haloacid dehalogenase type II [Candidatus Limnocylindrales bacterium]|nr:haloacid dehalogenase type II [Candidatus Limnocylindrales bacterium]